MQTKIGKKIINNILQSKGYNIQKIYPVDLEKEFSDIYETCKEYTMGTAERMYALYNAVKYIIRHKIKGDFVECGVWQGGSSMVIAMTLLQLSSKDRKIYLYDTFEGAVEPTEEDVTNEGVTGKWLYNLNKNGLYSCKLEEVKTNMEKTEYPKNNLIYVKGDVCKTIPKEIPDKIALLRLDTDWYKSTKHELEHLYPKLGEKGVLLLDDYGCWKGSKKAVDEYILESNQKILLNRIDGSGRIGIK